MRLRLLAEASASAVSTNSNLSTDDQQHVYEIHDNNCFAHQTQTTQMPSVWAFLEHAVYKGEKEYKHRKYDLWVADFHATSVELAVYAGNENVPALLTKKAPGFEYELEFFSFDV